MSQMWQNLRFGVRQLRKSPGFALVAVLTLALGIGANTAMFSVVDTVLLRPFAYYQPNRLALVSETLNGGTNDDYGVAAQEYLDYREQNRVFSQVAAFEQDGFNLTGEGEPLRVNAARISSSAFSVLGVSPTIGRAFSSDEDRHGSDNVVELSYSLWQHQYHGDRNILGRTVKLDENPYTVVGVMPPSFRFPYDGKPFSEQADIWLPIGFSPEVLKPENRLMELGVGLIGRLKPGVTLQQAQHYIQNVATAFQVQHPDTYSGAARVTPHVYAYAAHAVDKARPLLLLLSAAVVCVLLIACANVANLLLSRATSRWREMAIRSAVGARRTALLSQCLTESLLLALLGGAAGIGLAWAAVTGLRNFGPATMPRLHEMAMHPIALLFTMGLSVLTTVIFGIVPAWRQAHIAPQASLKESPQTGASRGNLRLQNSVAIGEIALALVLLIAGSLLLRSFSRLLSTPLGFDPHGAFVVRTVFDRARYPEPARRATAQEAIIARLSQIPGATAVSAATHLPLSDARQIGFRLENEPSSGSHYVFHWAENSLVAPGYFHLMGIPLLAGRDFTMQDTPDKPPAAIVNRAMARAYFKDSDPVGQRFHWGDRALFTIVGVVDDVHISALDADPPPMIYNSMFQVQSGASIRTAFLLRTARSGKDLFHEVQQAVWSVDGQLPLYNSTTFDDLVSESVAQRRFTMLLLGAFSLVALFLAAIGLFGVISYLVAQHQREMALRMALGADRADINRMVLWRGARLGITGCVIGFALSLAASRLLTSSLYHVSRFDPATLITVPLLLISVVLLAAYLPARRAAAVDPMQALRTE
jgi:putative ABC transport system permease protein